MVEFLTDPFNAYCLGVAVGACWGIVVGLCISIVIKGNKP